MGVREGPLGEGVCPSLRSVKLTLRVRVGSSLDPPAPPPTFGKPLFLQQSRAEAQALVSWVKKGGISGQGHDMWPREQSQGSCQRSSGSQSQQVAPRCGATLHLRWFLWPPSQSQRPRGAREAVVPDALGPQLPPPRPTEDLPSPATMCPPLQGHSGVSPGGPSGASSLTPAALNPGVSCPQAVVCPRRGGQV